MYSVFIPHQVGRFCTVNRGHCWFLRHYCTKIITELLRVVSFCTVIPYNCCATMCSNNGNQGFPLLRSCAPFMQVACPHTKSATDREAWTVPRGIFGHARAWRTSKNYSFSPKNRATSPTFYVSRKLVTLLFLSRTDQVTSPSVTSTPLHGTLTAAVMGS